MFDFMLLAALCPKNVSCYPTQKRKQVYLSYVDREQYLEGSFVVEQCSVCMKLGIQSQKGVDYW